MSEPAAPPATAAGGLTRSARSASLRSDAVAARAVQICALVGLAIVVLVVVFVGVRALPVLRDPGLGGILTSTDWNPDAAIGFGTATATFGALMPVGGSLIVVGLALLVSVPLSLAVASVMVEVHPVAGERWIRPVVEILVGVPSVVYGWIGLTTLVPLLRRFAPAGDDGSSYVAAAIVLAVMVLPTIATLAADALRALPPALREASYALGATQWQTIRRVLLPAARAGIVSAVVLGFARAMGEALAVALVIGDVNHLPDIGAHGLRALFGPGSTMTVTITDGINNLAINPQGTAARYLLATILLVMVFAAISVVRALQRRSTAVT